MKSKVAGQFRMKRNADLIFVSHTDGLSVNGCQNFYIRSNRFNRWRSDENHRKCFMAIYLPNL